jgi:DNA-binding CsgD family transcriptional regulator
LVTHVLAGGPDAALLVVGEAGVGKSRLVAAATDTVRADVLMGGCLPLSEGRPFLPIVDVLRGMADLDGGQLLKAALADCAEFVRTELARLLPELEETSERRTAGADDEWRRQRLLDAVRQVLRAAASLQPLAVVIEDVHWADRSTLELLDYMLAPSHETGAPMLITSRAEETPATGWLERAQRIPRIKRLDLAPLTRDETADQIELLIGERPTRELVDQTYSRTEGNAFFTEQLVSAGGTLSTGLGTLLLSRTAEVGETGRELLEVLAVAAQPVDEPALVQVCGRTTSEVRGALRDLLFRRLLRAPEPHGRHQLRHALLGEAISDDMLPGARRDVHLSLARMLADRDDPALAARIAEHLAAAGRPGEELRWRVAAARQAEAALAATVAFAHWQRVLDLWDDTADTGIELADVYLHAATTAEGAGHQPAAAALLEEALARVAATARPETQVRLYCEVGRSRGIQSMEAGLAALGTAIRIGEQLPPSPAYVQALIHYMHLLDSNGRLEDYLDLITKGLAAVRQLDDPGDEKILLLYWAHTALRTGHRDDADEALRRLSQIHVDDPITDIVIAVMLTDLLEQSGDLAGAVEVGRQALARPDLDGQSDWAGFQMLRGNVCGPLVELGDIDSAAALIDPVTAGEPDWDTSVLHLNRIAVDLLRGRLSEAARRWTDCAPFVDVLFDKAAIPWCRMLCLELAVWRTDPDEALAAALTTLADVADTHVNPWAAGLYTMTLRAYADRAELARAAGNAQRLRAVRAAAARLDDIRTQARIDPFAPQLLPVTCAAHGRSWRAEWSRVRGESDAAGWEQAAGAWDELGRPHRAAYARWRQAEALLALPYGRGAATPVLREAAVQAEQHVPLSNAVRDLARRARIELTEPDAPPTEPAVEPPVRTFGLTDREQAVLQLVAEGKTNGQIGATLFISTKTASVHVSNILRKLDVSTRVQAATVAERAGLLDASERR